MRKVLVLEKHNLPCGCATSFVRGSYEFQVTLHEMCQMGPGVEGEPRVQSGTANLGYTIRLSPAPIR